MLTKDDLMDVGLMSSHAEAVVKWLTIEELAGTKFIDLDALTFLLDEATADLQVRASKIAHTPVFEYDEEKVKDCPVPLRPMNMRISPDKVIAFITNNRDAQKKTLEALRMGIGGFELADKYSPILEVCYTDLLIRLLASFPDPKVNQLVTDLDREKYPNLSRAISARGF